MVGRRRRRSSTGSFLFEDEPLETEDSYDATGQWTTSTRRRASASVESASATQTIERPARPLPLRRTPRHVSPAPAFDPAQPDGALDELEVDEHPSTPASTPEPATAHEPATIHESATIDEPKSPRRRATQVDRPLAPLDREPPSLRDTPAPRGAGPATPRTASRAPGRSIVLVGGLAVAVAAVGLLGGQHGAAVPVLRPSASTPPVRSAPVRTAPSGATAAQLRAARSAGASQARAQLRAGQRVAAQRAARARAQAAARRQRDQRARAPAARVSRPAAAPATPRPVSPGPVTTSPSGAARGNGGGGGGGSAPAGGGLSLGG